MATPNNLEFKVPDLDNEHPDARLAVPSIELWKPSGIAACAERAASTARQVLGVDSQWAENLFTGQLEAMDLTVFSETSEPTVPIVHVPVGLKDALGNRWIPSHVIKGRDKLMLQAGIDRQCMSIARDVFDNRPSSWWNKSRLVGDSELIEAPLVLVLAETALRGTDKTWTEQQDELQQRVFANRSTDNGNTLEGLTPLDWVMMDADAVINDSPRPAGTNRFVQHQPDSNTVESDSGPSARASGGGQLIGSLGLAVPGNGFRVVTGQRQQPQ